MVAGAASGTVAGAAAGAAMLPVIEGLKKSAPFLAVSGLVTKSVDALSETDFSELEKKVRRIPFDRYRAFMIENGDILRRLVGSRKEGRWLNEHLDWLTDHETLAPL